VIANALRGMLRLGGVCETAALATPTNTKERPTRDDAPEDAYDRADRMIRRDGQNDVCDDEKDRDRGPCVACFPPPQSADSPHPASLGAQE
jgi:hypothetical protein